MCSCGITFGVSAMAAITSSVKSRGCGEVKRTRSSPSIFPQARSSLEKASRSPMSEPYALTFWPSRVISETPRRPGPRSRRECRRCGGPSPSRAGPGRCRRCRCCCSPRRWRPTRRTRTRGGWGSVEGNASSDSAISTCASSWIRARSSSTGSLPMLCVPKTTSTQGARRTMVSRSFWARQPPTAICIPGRLVFIGASRPRLP